MPADEDIDIGTRGHHAQPLALRILERGTHEFFSDAATAKLGRHERMGHDHFSIAQLVVGHGETAIGDDLEAALCGVVPDDDLFGTRIHAPTVADSKRNANARSRRDISRDRDTRAPRRRR